jgi:type II secretory pathway pseudopilin PulG
MIQRKIKLFTDGFTLIEALIFLFIFSVSVLAIYNAFSLGINYSIENKKRLQAISLANEEIEKMKNLGYANLSTGTAENVEKVSSGVKYYVTTRITSFDDEADGSVPADSISWDYLKIGVDVKWSLDNDNKMITMNATIVPPVREEDADKGYMRLHIIDQNGLGLTSAHITVTKLSNNSVVYSGNVNTSGNLFLTGLDPGKHKIAVSSYRDYFPIETMNETASFIPADMHPDIAVKTLIERTLQTDKVSILKVTLKDTFGNEIPHLGFDIVGGKYLGIENNTAPVYGYSDSISNSDGTESFSDMSFGPYFFNFTDLNDEQNSKDYQFLWMTPICDSENKILLNADDTLEAEAIVADEDEPSLLVTILDDADDKPISGVEVHVEHSDDPAYDEKISTNKFGKAYFPLTSGQIIDDDYNLTVMVDGYDTETKTVTIDKLTSETIKLTAN